MSSPEFIVLENGDTKNVINVMEIVRIEDVSPTRSRPKRQTRIHLKNGEKLVVLQSAEEILELMCGTPSI